MENYTQWLEQYPVLSVPVALWALKQWWKERRRNHCLTVALHRTQEKHIEQLNETTKRLFQAFGNARKPTLKDLANDSEWNRPLR